MNLYKILVRHFAPKDQHNAIKTYIVAKNEMEVCIILDNFAYWDQKEDDEILRNIDQKFLKKDIEYYEDIIDSEGQLQEEDRSDLLFSWRQFIISTRGEIGTKWADYDDLFYGKTHYGWELVKENITDEEYKTLLELNILKIE